MKKYTAKKLLFSVLISLPGFVIASNMGNGPAMLATWVVGGVCAIIFTCLVSKKDPNDESDSMESFHAGKFVLVLLGSLTLVFFLGIFALSTG